MTRSQQKRALELLRRCLASGTIAKAYPNKPACLGDEIQVFLEKVEK